MQTPFDHVEGDGFITLYPFPAARHPSGRPHGPGDRGDFASSSRPTGVRGPDEVRPNSR